MANDFQSVADAQREATRALRTLTAQVRRQGELASGLLTESRELLRAPARTGGSDTQADFNRLAARRVARTGADVRPDDGLTVRGRGSSIPLIVARERTVAPARTGGSDPQADFNRLAAGRVAGTVADARSDDRLTVQGSGSSIPLLVASQRTVEEALNVTARSVRNLGVSMGRNTSALEQNSKDLRDGISGLVSSLLGGGSSKGGGGILSSLTGGFGLASVGLRIAGLFGSRKKEPEPLLPFELPPSIALERANSDNILARLPRVVRGNRNEVRAVAQDSVSAAPQIVVNVSAMDSQSFLDRSGDIALAVRDAMLHMHPVNDLVGEV